LPKPQVQAYKFTVHISYFLQNCKKAKSLKNDLLKLKNDISTILRHQKRAIADIGNNAANNRVPRGAERGGAAFGSPS
jgi:hypothetical protein